MRIVCCKFTVSVTGTYTAMLVSAFPLALEQNTELFFFFFSASRDQSFQASFLLVKIPFLLSFGIIDIGSVVDAFAAITARKTGVKILCFAVYSLYGRRNIVRKEIVVNGFFNLFDILEGFCLFGGDRLSK